MLPQHHFISSLQLKKCWSLSEVTTTLYIAIPHSLYRVIFIWHILTTLNVKRCFGIQLYRILCRRFRKHYLMKSYFCSYFPFHKENIAENLIKLSIPSTTPRLYIDVASIQICTQDNIAYTKVGMYLFTDLHICRKLSILDIWFRNSSDNGPHMYVCIQFWN